MVNNSPESPKSEHWVEKRGIAIPYGEGAELPNEPDDVKVVIFRYTRGNEELFLSEYIGPDRAGVNFDDFYFEHRELILNSLAKTIKEQRESFEALPVEVQNRLSAFANDATVANDSMIMPFAAYLNQVILRNRFYFALGESMMPPDPTAEPTTPSI